MLRLLSTILGIVMLALIATALTETSLAVGKTQTTSPEPATKAVTTTAKPATPTASTTTTPSPAAPASPTATVNGYVHMRTSPTTSASIVFDLNAGDVVSYGQVDDGLWQTVTYQGIHGYIYKTYLDY